jgi:RNA polymerase sigma-70 factor (ECF subfamily)
MRTPPTDEQLLARLQAGEDGAMSELVEAYGSKIYRLAFRHLRNKEDAEEIVQDVLYKVHRNIRAFRGDAALASWIYRITFNAAMSRLRTAPHRLSANEAPRPAANEADELAPRLEREPADWSNMADEGVFRVQLRRRLFRAIGALPAIYRAPVVLRDIQGMSTEEASAMLKVKDQTLKSRLHRGRLILRAQLADFAGGLSLHHAFGV